VEGTRDKSRDREKAYPWESKDHIKNLALREKRGREGKKKVGQIGTTLKKKSNSP